MKKWTIILTIALLAIVFAVPAQSGMKKLAQTGMNFLKVDLSPRAAAMGAAYVTMGFGAEAIYYNPAGLARMDNDVDLFANQTRWIADITYNSIGVALNWEQFGVFALSAMFADYGTIEGTMVANNNLGYVETGDVNVGALAVGLSYGINLTDRFSIGATIKWVNQQLGESELNDGNRVDNEVSGLAFDFGTLFYPGFKSFRFGMSIRNFSDEFTYQKESFQLPLTFAIGIGMDLMDFIETENHSLNFAIDAIHPRDYSERLHIGAEYVLMDMLSIRAGYKYNYDEEGLTLGAGFHTTIGLAQVSIEYAYAPTEYFGSVNRFGLGLKF